MSVLAVVGRSGVNGTRGLLQNGIACYVILDDEAHFRAGEIMSGLQYVRYVGGERQIQFVADRESGTVKSVISADSIDFQQVSARVIIRIGVVILYEPLGI